MYKSKIFLFLLSVLIMSGLGACLTSHTAEIDLPYPGAQATETPAETAPIPNALDTITGRVIDKHGSPVSGATVKVRTTQKSALTDRSGCFSLPGMEPGKAVSLTAWAPGFYIGGGGEAVLPGSSDIILTLESHPTADNPVYTWVSAFSSSGNSGAGEDGNCQNCHEDRYNKNLPFPEWQADAHALSTQNPRFLSMYIGSDLMGNLSPATTFTHQRDYGRVPLPPDLNQPYFGPGYRLDFPETAGNCSTCHAPAAAVHDPYGVDPTRVSGVGSEGTTCDLCHKIWDVRLDPQTSLPYANLPGVLSFEFRRPPDGHQLFIGPYDDVAPGEDTYSPIQQQSQFCAPCHYGVFWNTVIYNSFGEWLESPYSDPVRARIAGLASAKSCQDCHMPPGQSNLIAAPEKGGLERDPQTVYSHRMPGASDENLLQNALTMISSGRIEGDTIVVEVTLVNDQTGHHIPTDSPLRQLLLLVDARDIAGQPLELVEGPVLPEWAGMGNVEHGYYAGLPGTAYAKVLSELWTGVEPSGAYWNHTLITSDNRLAVMQSDTTRYVFAAREDGKASVDVSLFYRRAFKQLMDWKHWDTPDILMEFHQLSIP